MKRDELHLTGQENINNSTNRLIISSTSQQVAVGFKKCNIKTEEQTN